MIKHLALYLALLPCVNGLHADALDDLVRMNALYQKKTSLYMEFDLVLRYKNNRKTEEKHTCVLSQNANRTYYKALNTEYVNDGTNSFFLDHTQKLLIIGTSRDQEAMNAILSKPTGSFAGDSAKLMKEYSIQYVDTGRNTILLLPKEESSEFASIYITLNSDYSLSKIVYHYKEDKSKGVKITGYEITYRIQTFHAESKYFSSSKYASVKNDKIFPKKQYASYKIVDKRINYNH